MNNLVNFFGYEYNVSYYHPREKYGLNVSILGMGYNLDTIWYYKFYE